MLGLFELFKILVSSSCRSFLLGYHLVDFYFLHIFSLFLYIQINYMQNPNIIKQKITKISNNIQKS